MVVMGCVHDVHDAHNEFRDECKIPGSREKAEGIQQHTKWCHAEVGTSVHEARPDHAAFLTSCSWRKLDTLPSSTRENVHLLLCMQSP